MAWSYLRVLPRAAVTTLMTVVPAQRMARLARGNDLRDPRNCEIVGTMTQYYCIPQSALVMGIVI